MHEPSPALLIVGWLFFAGSVALALYGLYRAWTGRSPFIQPRRDTPFIRRRDTPAMRRLGVAVCFLWLAFAAYSAVAWLLR
jgi:hypothetical protein